MADNKFSRSQSLMTGFVPILIQMKDWSERHLCRDCLLEGATQGMGHNGA